MATPTMITLTGTVETPPGTPDGTAQVTIQQQVWMRHPDGTVIEPTVYTGVANSNGDISMLVPATNDPDWLPVDFQMRVIFDGIENPRWSKPFRAAIPHDAPGGTMTLGELIPVGMANEGAFYAAANHSHPLDVSEAELTAALNAMGRVVTGGELILPRGEVNGSAPLTTDILWVTHFIAARTQSVLSVRTTVDTPATGSEHAWLGCLVWTPGVGYSPYGVSVDDPTRWTSGVSYDTLVFGVGDFGAANLSDPGFDTVAGQRYAFFLQWVGSGNAPTLKASVVNTDDAFIEPRENGFMGLSAPPSGPLQPGWLVGSGAKFQGFLRS